MTDPSPTAEPRARPLPPILATTLLTEGLRAVADRWRQALALWAVGVALVGAPRLIRGAQPLRHVLWSPGIVGQTLALMILSAILTALTLRLFLGSAPAWLRRPDRGFWICVGLLVASRLGNWATSLLALRDIAPAGLVGLELKLGLSTLIQVLLAWIYARLLLWPIGALMGNSAMTAGRSWALMRGQVAGFVIAAIILELPIFLLTSGYMWIGAFVFHQRLTGQFPWLALATVTLGPASQIVQHAMATLIYRAKTGLSEPAS